MTERAYPSTKPIANGGPPPAAAAANGESNQAFPANKAQLHNPARLPYHPLPPPRRRHSRSFCCSCCLWTTLLILLVLLLAAVAGAIFYVMYRPHRPSFSVASLRLSRFNLTNTAVTSAFNVTLVARNPNSKIIFFYEQISVRVFSGGIEVGDGAFPAFKHGKKNMTTLRAVVSDTNSAISADADISPLKSSVRSGTLSIQIQLNTKVRSKIGKITTKNLEIGVTCDGIRVSIPNGKTASVATISKEKCKVDPRFKIVKWTV